MCKRRSKGSLLLQRQWEGMSLKSMDPLKYNPLTHTVLIESIELEVDHVCVYEE